jgi:hypothetical protein
MYTKRHNKSIRVAGMSPPSVQVIDNIASTTWYASNMGMSSPPAERSVITWSSIKEDMLLRASMMSSPEKDMLRI